MESIFGDIVDTTGGRSIFNGFKNVLYIGAFGKYQLISTLGLFSTGFLSSISHSGKIQRSRRQFWLESYVHRACLRAQMFQNCSSIFFFFSLERKNMLRVFILSENVTFLRPNILSDFASSVNVS